MNENLKNEVNVFNSKTSGENGTGRENPSKEKVKLEMGDIEDYELNEKGGKTEVAGDAHQNIKEGNSENGGKCDAHQDIKKGNNKNGGRCSDESNPLRKELKIPEEESTS